MKRQKGQAVVEFAMVFPFLLMLLFGVIFFGLLFADYMTLSNAARSSARDAALYTGTTDSSDHFSAVQTYYTANTRLLTSLYTNPTFQIASGDETLTNSVQVTVTTTLNTSFPGVGVLDYFGMGLPRNYTIQYFMYKEPTSGTGA